MGVSARTRAQPTQCENRMLLVCVSLFGRAWPNTSLTGEHSNMTAVQLLTVTASHRKVGASEPTFLMRYTIEP